MDRTKDEAFNKFLEKIQNQNKADLALQALQVKYEREVAGEDDDKREKQLDKIAELLEKVEKAITGVSVKIDFQPVVNALENQTQVLKKSLEEQVLMRKLSEGSLEYDKESAQYRNVSGRELTSDVSGKTIKEGGYVDFETAANRLQGQGKRVREANQLQLKPIELGTKTAITGQPGSVEPKDEKEGEITGFGGLGDLGKAIGSRVKGIFDFMTNKVEKPNPDVTGLNPEADNIQSTQEIMADAAKQDVELTKENNNILEQQLKELKKISAALAPATPADLPEGRLKATPASAEAQESGGGLGEALSGMGGIAKKAGSALLKGAKAAGKGALALGKGVARFAGSTGGKLLGAAAAVGLGAYTAYQGYTAAEDSKQAKLADIQSRLDSGEIDQKQAAALRNEAGNTATVEKSGAVGEGTGMAAGAIAGGKAGAAIGTMLGGPIGTGIGLVAGGAIGAFAGSKAGKYVGEKVGAGINKAKELGKGISDWFSSKKAELKDTYNRGISGTLAFQNQEEEVAKRAKAAGVIDEKGEILDFDKYSKISDQVEKEVKAADPSANRMADMNVSSRESLSETSFVQNGKQTLTSDQRQGITSEKSFLGSTTLGALFSAKGLETGRFSGMSATEKSVDGKDERKLGEVIGTRISSGSLFRPDTYKVSAGDGEDLEVSKSQYYKMQALAKEGKTEEIEKMMADIRAERLTPLGEITGEMLTPVSPGAKGLSLVKDSTENTELTRAANKPAPAAQPIVASSVNNVNTQSYVPIKPSPRPDRSGSALDRYNDRVAAY